MEPPAESQRMCVEVCVQGPDGARVAESAGAQRVELCAALALGGVTPGPGLFAATASATALPIMVLVRPRRGDFLYSTAEFEALRRDVVHYRDAGAAGVVLGVLTAEGRVDRARTAQLVELARPAAVTFHRAFDHARDLDEALDDLVELGIERVLTSGGEPDAPAGRESIARLVARAAGRLSVMAGGGVNEHNAVQLVRDTGVRELHLSASSSARSAMLHHNPHCALGASVLPLESELHVTDGARLGALIGALASSR